MAELPVRIQRKRTRGWRAPEGTIMCTRPGPYGNPYRVERRDDWHEGQVWLLVGPVGDVLDWTKTKGEAIGSALESFREYISDPVVRERFRTGLAGAKFLACWCPLSTRDCHVEIILEALRDG